MAFHIRGAAGMESMLFFPHLSLLTSVGLSSCCVVIMVPLGSKEVMMLPRFHFSLDLGGHVLDGGHCF